MTTSIPESCFVVVADGTQAALFINTSKSGELSLEAKGRLKPVDLEHDGPSGKTPSEMSDSDIDEATFAKQLTQRLNRMLDEGDFNRIILAADPITLGQMRGMMSNQLSAAVISEIPKTLTNSPLADIEQSITNEL